MVRGDVPGVPPRRLHLADRDEAGQPPHRAPAPRGRALVDAWPRCGPGRPTPTTSWSGSGARRCCYQFHDILPGSSIAWVHREARETYAALAGALESVIGTALRRAVRRRVGCRWRSTPRRSPSTGCPRWAADRSPAGARRRRVTRRRGRHVPAERAPPRRGGRPRPGRLRASTSPPAARCSPPPRTCSSCTRTPRTASTPGTSRPSPRTGSPRCTTPISVDVPGCRDDGTAEVHVVRRSGPSSFEQWVRLAPGSRRVDFETGRGLAARRDDAQGGVPARRARRPLHLGDRLRPRAPADAREHRLGRRAVRDLRAPVDPRRRAGLRRGAGQRRHLRPRRRALDAAATGAARARRRCGSRWPAARASPTRTPTAAGTRSATAWSPARTCRPPSRRATRSHLPPRSVTGARRRARRAGRRGARGRRGREAGRGPQRRRRGAASTRRTAVAATYSSRPGSTSRTCGSPTCTSRTTTSPPTSRRSQVADDGLTFPLGPFQIVTLRLTPRVPDSLGPQ